ncbi:MAG: hypothetical protein Q8894_02165 [Sweet potato little leaf phytoplasma]|nr:hypothetical protein [Pigeon pea little leaf phytoplasma]MDV3196612.1 hypothetical protein [Pigeon pea little leaf phytoplasma]MDV3204570.1 hypothetical protein [Sweet potato little leaf phytoplasma]
MIKRKINKLDKLKTKIIYFQKTSKINDDFIDHNNKKIFDFYQKVYLAIVNFNKKKSIDFINLFFQIENYNNRINFNNNNLIIVTIDKIIDHLKKEEINNTNVNINNKIQKIFNIFDFIDILYQVYEYIFESRDKQIEFITLKILCKYNLKEYFILKIQSYLKKIIKKRQSIFFFRIPLILILFYFFSNLRNFNNFIKFLLFYL